MIQDNAQFLLLGESGSGKTTLLPLLGGLLTTQKGTIEVNGTDLTKLSESELDRFRGNSTDLFSAQSFNSSTYR